MKITKNLHFIPFKYEKVNIKFFKLFHKITKQKNEILNSLSKNYQNNYTKNLISGLKRFKFINLIGIGGSSLGALSIYKFLKKKIKINIEFFDSLNEIVINKKNKNSLNVVISKSGNTLETIVNSNILFQKKNNVFITENNDSYLISLANKLKATIIEHNNFIGGRYSVLSEVGMLPSELMGLDPKKFRVYDKLIKNKKFINALLINVSNTLNLIKNKKTNSIILNYDKDSEELFFWYQQLIAESLGKEGKGVLPIISNMPRDNHSLMQLYLDGPKTNFYTFFFVDQKYKNKINNKIILKSHNYLKDKYIFDIKKSQFNATQSVFKKVGIPFRTFIINRKDESSLGELFCFFILETILLGQALGINPFNQPKVELIKKETLKNLT